MPAAADPGLDGDVSVESDAVAHALGELGDVALAGAPLGALTTYRVGGVAEVLVRPRDADELARVAAVASATRLPVLVLGRGSNLLVADAGYRGIVVSLSEMSAGIDVDRGERTVRAGGAVLLPVLARRLAAIGLVGFEWAVGVPGSIGGAVRMNAGGHGSDMAASLVDATVCDLDTGAVASVPAADLGLRFRASALGDSSAVVDARLQLTPGDPVRAKAELSEIVAWRRANQPGGQNAGSVFVNPVPGEVSAGALVDGLGLRGLRIGSASVSEKHANFIQADEGGSADDVRALMDEVRDRVERGTGYALRSEIRLVGFDDDHDGARRR
ncbi:UDP-N-acetylmuramate dehydrogenase [Ilumatobacter sp.]|uniref:UDP-N-acetylmuramate dehydrogenase n=1 Tax=Ilumatobacter sp. TaxID=1967498 RepID=UPI003B517B29